MTNTRNQKPAGVGGLAIEATKPHYTTNSQNVQTVSRALEYDEHGLALVPLPYGAKLDYQRWTTYRDVTTNRREVIALFSGKPQNIGVICGASSGNLVALDADTPTVYDEIEARLDGLGIRTWTVRRPPNGTAHDGGGLFALRTPEPIKSAGRPDLDILGEDKYFIAPDSLHPGGTVYYDETPLPVFELDDLSALAWLNLEIARQANP